MKMENITLDQLQRGCTAFCEREPRDAMYRIGRKLVEEDWGSSAGVADGLGVILLTWNQAAYRYGSFDFNALEIFIERNREALDSFRHRKIDSFDLTTDRDRVRDLFSEALEALSYTSKKRKTPVGAAKALHILAPSFFPLWDVEIAKACGCYWYTPDRAVEKYIEFMTDARAEVLCLEAQFEQGKRPEGLPDAPNLAGALSSRAGRAKTMLKLLDEYLYAKHTKNWI